MYQRKKNLKYIPILTHTQKTQMRLQYRGIQMHVTSRLFKSHCIALKYQRGSYLELCHSVSNDTASFFRHVNLIVTEEQRSNSIENRSQLDGLLFLLLSSVLWCRFLFLSHAWRLDFLLLRCMTGLMDSEGNQSVSKHHYSLLCLSR